MRYQCEVMSYEANQLFNISQVVRLCQDSKHDTFTIAPVLLLITHICVIDVVPKVMQNRTFRCLE